MKVECKDKQSNNDKMIIEGEVKRSKGIFIIIILEIVLAALFLVRMLVLPLGVPRIYIAFVDSIVPMLIVLGVVFRKRIAWIFAVIFGWLGVLAGVFNIGRIIYMLVFNGVAINVILLLILLIVLLVYVLIIIFAYKKDVRGVFRKKNN